jgi:hypothetical protein
VLDELPGSPAAPRRVLVPASSPSAGGVPSLRWGASRWVASVPFLWMASLEQKTSPRGKADGATRSARHRDTATPRLRRPFGGAASLGPSAGVRLTLGFRPPKPAGKNHHGSTAGFQKIQTLRTTRRRRPTRWVFPRRGHGRGALGCGRPGHMQSTTNGRKSQLDGRNSRTQGSARRHHAARRRVEGFSLGSANGGVARRQHQERPASRLGVAMERGLLRTSQRNVETSLVLCTATAALKSTSGPGAPSVAARQFCGSMASIQARINGDASRRRGSITGRRPRGRRD